MDLYRTENILLFWLVSVSIIHRCSPGDWSVAKLGATLSETHTVSMKDYAEDARICVRERPCAIEAESTCAVT